MARLWSSGAELNSLTNGVETGMVTFVTIDSSIFRSGLYSYKSTSSNSRITHSFLSSASSNAFYFRVYFKFTTWPGADSQFFHLRDNGSARADIKLLNADKTLQCNVATTSYGTSSPIVLDTWYRLEVFYHDTGTSIAARLDGIEFANSTTVPSGEIFPINYISIGWQNGVGVLYFDDIAINDTNGSFQNSWPGPGSIVNLFPDSSGDNTTWIPTSGENYTNVDDGTPDDATTIISSNTLNQIDDFNLSATPAAIASNAIINVVQVGVRFNGAGEASNASFVLRIKSSSGGTVEESGNISPSNTVWSTNSIFSAKNYSLTAYDLPGESTNILTKGTLDTTQIGVRLSSISTNAAQISALWLLVEYQDEILVSNTRSSSNERSLFPERIASSIRNSSGTRAIY